MATGLAVQRSHTTAGSPAPVRVPNLPIIEHPMAKLGDKSDLAIRGSSSYSPHRENTVVTVRKGKAELGLRRTPKGDIESPRLRKSGPDRILHWPPGQGPQEYLKGPAKPGPKSKEYKFQPRNTSELIDFIKEKMVTGYYGIRHLFKANDPTGKGAVTREALQRILYTLCGYITPFQYTQLLKEINLDGKTTIPFDSFVANFKDEGSEEHKSWVNAIQSSSVYGPDGETLYPEANLRRTDITVFNPYTSMPFSDAIFKEKCKSRNFDAKKVFPPAVFEPNGLIVPPQLREAFATLAIYMTDDDFRKLWQRYDREGTGAIYANNFFKLCGLDPFGRPRNNVPSTPRGAAYPMPRRPHSDISHTSSLDKDRALKKLIEKEKQAIKIPTQTIAENGSGDKGEEKQDSGEEKPLDAPDGVEESPDKPDATEDTPLRIRTKPARVPPKLENIIDCLHFKFEESYNAMLSAFQLFDFLNDNYISRVDFRRVLKEFGFTVSMTEMDHFLKRSGMRSTKGQLNYKDFLVKYQTKSEGSLTSKIATDSNHTFHGDLPEQKADLSAEGLEAKLVDFFHGDFIKLLSYYRRCDKYGLGVITGHEFRAGLEKRLGYRMSEKQWEQLKSDVGTDSDGLVPYVRFLDMFDITPGAWNTKSEGLIQVSQIPQSDMPVPPAVERLKEMSDADRAPSEPLPAQEDRSRSLAEINRRNDTDRILKQLDELFKNRFHTFDKYFKQMDRRMTGRMSKWQFGALLKMCDFPLEAKELDKVWASLNIATDGMYSYSTLIQHFVKYKTPRSRQKDPVVYENLFNVDEQEDYMQEYLTQEDTTELVETARRIQIERKAERTERQALARLSRAEKKEEAAEATPRAVTQNNIELTPPASRMSTIPSAPASRASFSSVQSVRTKSLLVKIRNDVINNWEGLKSVFKYIDRQGIATITITEMKEIMTSMSFSLEEEELTELCRRFDLLRNGRFNYLEFMKCYAQKTNKAEKSHVYSKYTHKLQQQLLKDHRSLRRAFRSMDKGSKGYLSVREFKKALQVCNIRFSNDDFYYILSEFDQDLKGRISYDSFISTLLTS